MALPMSPWPTISEACLERQATQHENSLEHSCHCILGHAPWSSLQPPSLVIRPDSVNKDFNMFPNTMVGHSGPLRFHKAMALAEHQSIAISSRICWFVKKAGQHNECKTCILLFEELKSWNIHICGRSEPLAKSKHKSSMIYSRDNTTLNKYPMKTSQSICFTHALSIHWTVGGRFVFA